MLCRKICPGMLFILCRAGIGYCSASSINDPGAVLMQDRGEDDRDATVQSSEPRETDRSSLSEKEATTSQNPKIHQAVANREETMHSTGEVSGAAEENPAFSSGEKGGHAPVAQMGTEAEAGTGKYASNDAVDSQISALRREMHDIASALLSESPQSSSLQGEVVPVVEKTREVLINKIAEMISTLVEVVVNEAEKSIEGRVREIIFEMLEESLPQAIEGIVERKLNEILPRASGSKGEPASPLGAISIQDEAKRAETTAGNGSQFHLLNVFYDELSASVVKLDMSSQDEMVLFEDKSIDKESLAIYMNDIVCEHSEQFISRSNGLVGNLERVFLKEMRLLELELSPFKAFVSSLRDIIVTIDMSLEGCYDDPQVVKAFKDAIPVYRDKCLADMLSLAAGYGANGYKSQEVEELLRFMTGNLSQAVDEIFAKMTPYLENSLERVSVMATDCACSQSSDTENIIDIGDRMLEKQRTRLNQLKEGLLHSQRDHKAALNSLVDKYGYLVSEDKRAMDIGERMLDFLDLLDRASGTSNSPAKGELAKTRDDLLKKIGDMLDLYSPLNEIDGASNNK